MKKILMAGLAVLALGTCHADGGSLNSGLDMGNSLVKAAVDNQCRTELNETQRIALGHAHPKRQRNSRLGKIKSAGCASEEAPNQMTANELMQVVNPATRTQAVASVTAKTVTAVCEALV